jgi:hypothetical protein
VFRALEVIEFWQKIRPLENSLGSMAYV